MDPSTVKEQKCDLTPKGGPLSSTQEVAMAWTTGWRSKREKVPEGLGLRVGLSEEKIRR